MAIRVRINNVYHLSGVPCVPSAGSRCHGRCRPRCRAGRDALPGRGAPPPGRRQPFRVSAEPQPGPCCRRGRPGMDNQKDEKGRLLSAASTEDLKVRGKEKRKRKRSRSRSSSVSSTSSSSTTSTSSSSSHSSSRSSSSSSRDSSKTKSKRRKKEKHNKKDQQW
ncbi:ADP-ribosylation factor-like protein 6-interacting protein 4 [Lagopus leucura]|uniref:ADP-ribosylation factor-like protein 6-interacting protein 4 n=1 Tax=Lagopus leucura TaxID=30410 RepID=UPI001C66AFAD|nr:ADP-ribosylation factor-like protein 6-interacting protein 4 [Lagopus leucura]